MKLQNEAWRRRKRVAGKKSSDWWMNLRRADRTGQSSVEARGLALSTLQRHLRTSALGAATRGGGSRLVAVRVTR